MSDGKTHDRIGLFFGIVFAVIIFLLIEVILGISFAAGWLLSLFVFSPDTDLMPKKRTGILAFVLYPYSILFKHRGVSHSLLLGTLSRVIYIFITLIIIIFVLSKMGYVEFNFSNFWMASQQFIVGFSWDRPIYRIIIAFYGGMFGADTVHIMLDMWSSFVKKLKRDVL